REDASDAVFNGGAQFRSYARGDVLGDAAVPDEAAVLVERRPPAAAHVSDVALAIGALVDEIAVWQMRVEHRDVLFPRAAIAERNSAALPARVAEPVAGIDPGIIAERDRNEFETILFVLLPVRLRRELDQIPEAPFVFAQRWLRLLRLSELFHPAFCVHAGSGVFHVSYKLR